MDYYQQSVEAHRKHRGKIEVVSKMPVTNTEELAVAYTPGVAQVSRLIAGNPQDARQLVATKNMVAVVTDGSAVLGLGNVGPEAALPVMEGKALLFKEFAGVDAFPIALNTQDVEEFIRTVEILASTFGGINLEDIAAPACFEIEQRLIESLSIPVFHDDQHGTAVVVLAGLINALKVVGKDIKTTKVVISGAGAAGVAIAKLLHQYGVGDLIVCDSKGVIVHGREDLGPVKEELLEFTNANNVSGDIREALRGADVFIGVSKGGLFTSEDIATMATDSIVFAMANPEPEIMPEQARAGGARVVATGRSDFPNQLNNVLVFPGIFKGLFASNARLVTYEMKIAAAQALAALVPAPTEDMIISSPFDAGVADVVANAVVTSASEQGQSDQDQ